MTDHPLTDEICKEIAEDTLYYDYTIPTFRFDMRAAADWQVSQIKEEVKRNLILWREAGHTIAADSCEDFFEEIMQAMRPPMTRQQHLAALFAQLQELTTKEERRDYPFWDPLNDLINDLEMEEDN